MFTIFILTISLPRDKITIIKLLHKIAGPNHNLGNYLKDAKDAVENTIDFDGFTNDYISIKLRVDEATLGRAAYYLMNHSEASIVDIMGIDDAACDFVLT